MDSLFYALTSSIDSIGGWLAVIFVVMLFVKGSGSSKGKKSGSKSNTAPSNIEGK